MSKPKNELTLLIHTGDKFFLNRYKAMRKTWLSDERWPFDRLTFTTGNTSLEKGLIQVTNSPRTGLPEEKIHNMNERVMQSIVYAWKHTNSDWYYKADDDTYIIASRLPSLYSSLTNPRDIAYYLGQCLHISTERARNHCLTSSCESIIKDNQTVTFAQGGTGYLLSRKTVELLAKRETEEQGCWRLAEDVTIGFCLYDMGIQCMDVSDRMVNSIPPTNWNLLKPKLETAVTLHKVLPEEVDIVDSLIA